MASDAAKSRNYTATNLGTLVSYSEAHGINAAGTIVGFSDVNAFDLHAVLWEGNDIRDLGTLGGVNSFASAINANGEVVGWSGTTEEALHAFVWRRGVMTDLGTLPNVLASAATAINSRGQIVGRSIAVDGEIRGVLWDRGRIIDLGSLGGTDGGGGAQRQGTGRRMEFEREWPSPCLPVGGWQDDGPGRARRQ